MVCRRRCRRAAAMLNPVLFLLVAVLSMGMAPAHANNADCWGFGQDDTSRPDVSCIPLTEQLLRSFRDAPRGYVLRAMDAPGQPDGNGSLHFMGNAKKGVTGDVDVMIKYGRVITVDALLDPQDEGGKPVHYRWSRYGRSCSDFPDSRKRCQ